MLRRTILVLGTALALSGCTQPVAGTATVGAPAESSDPDCPGKTASAVLESSEEATRALLPTSPRQTGLTSSGIKVKSRDDMIALEGDGEEVRAAFAKAGFVRQVQVGFDSGEEGTAKRFETYTIQWFESAAGACDFLVRERRSAKSGEVGPGTPEVPGSYRYGSHYYASKGRFLIWVYANGTNAGPLLDLLYDRLP